MDAIDSIKAWKVLAALSRGLGVKGASIETGIDMALCSRLLRRLEAELGLALLDHRIRPAQLTAQAKSLLPYANAIVSAQEHAVSASRLMTAEGRTVRLSIPVNVPRSGANRHIHDYADLDKGLAVEIVSDADHEDVLRGRVDIAYLPYRPPAEGLVIFSVIHALNVPLASPQYLKERGTPLAPEDLSGHSIILRSARHYPMTRALFRRSEFRPLVYGNIAFAGDVLSGKAALLAGEGIAIDLSYSSCQEEIESGKLIPVLGGWHRCPWDMTVVIAESSAQDSRLANFARWFALQEARTLSQRQELPIQILRRLAAAACRA